MGLQQFERRLERLFEGVFARAFRSGLEPVELGRRLARQMDRGRMVTGEGKVAPNHFRYRLAPDDHARFEGVADRLAADLADAAREHARDEGYRFLGRIVVELAADPSITPGRFELDAEVRAAPGGKPTGSIVLPDGKRVALGDRPITVGRLDTAEVRFTDLTVSRIHATIERDGDGFAVRDAGSQNGTRVNGQPTNRRRLEDGDVLSFGAVAVRFEAV